MRALLASALCLLLVGCNTVKPLRVPAQCNQICFLPCTVDGDTGVRWEADSNSPEAWDALAGAVLPALSDKLVTCEVRRKACVQCLQRLHDEKVIEL